MGTIKVNNSEALHTLANCQFQLAAISLVHAAFRAFPRGCKVRWDQDGHPQHGTVEKVNRIHAADGVSVHIIDSTGEYRYIPSHKLARVKE